MGRAIQAWIEQEAETNGRGRGAESKPSSLLRYIVLAGYHARAHDFA